MPTFVTKAFKKSASRAAVFGLISAIFGILGALKSAQSAPQLIRYSTGGGNGCISASLLQQTVDTLVENELLPARVDMAKHVDASYLPFPCN